MCKYAGFSHGGLYKTTKEELPHIEPVEYEVWTCKVVNSIFLLNMKKQPSLCHRAARSKDARRRLTKKQKIM
eukprot:4315845-Pyramimonas_sp.AAC.1